MPSTLDHLPLGAVARILHVPDSDALGKRLAEMGFTRGAPIGCLFAAPLGDPVAYHIRGTVLALRRADAAKVTLDADVQT